jgi:hypothetical protein
LDADGVAITLAYTGPDRLTVCATDPTTERIENLQDVLGEGPGAEAYLSGEIVSACLEGEQTERWPMFTEALRAAIGAVSLYAIPIQPGGDTLGVLTLYQSRPRPLARPMREAQFLANAIGVAIAGDKVAREDSPEAIWSARDRINQGTGMVVAQLAISPEDALALLRAHAFAQEATLDEVATAVLEKRLRFTDNDRQEGGRP